jgi:spore coat protein CotF
MSHALRFSLNIKREIISNDLLRLCKSNFIQVTISEQELEILLMNKMYDMIERLILGNTLLEADASHLDVDEIF